MRARFVLLPLFASNDIEDEIEAAVIWREAGQKAKWLSAVRRICLQIYWLYAAIFN